ncbi:hypothetical protein [Fonticella tunisiensis]|uniref:Uncharacterized protein n=1 Tax=Fonticella tunisiensis TaxID=1096341 RepID=A0A4R7KV39_9CLOT|nr:hypothetical protein [Fonticella tunisiensis]TDT63624.1 hypothetical protein EDD71_10149 [Fonticella tunisiensis]
MKKIDKRATAILLAALDREIDIKCLELKEKRREAKLKKIFFSSCLFILFSFIIQVLFRAFNLSFLFTFLAYQGLALSLLTPLVLNLNRGGVSK